MNSSSILKFSSISLSLVSLVPRNSITEDEIYSKIQQTDNYSDEVGFISSSALKNERSNDEWNEIIGKVRSKFADQFELEEKFKSHIENYLALQINEGDFTIKDLLKVTVGLNEVSPSFKPGAVIKEFSELEIKLRKVVSEMESLWNTKNDEDAAEDLKSFYSSYNKSCLKEVGRFKNIHKECEKLKKKLFKCDSDLKVKQLRKDCKVELEKAKKTIWSLHEAFMTSKTAAVEKLKELSNKQPNKVID